MTMVDRGIPQLCKLGKVSHGTAVVIAHVETMGVSLPIRAAQSQSFVLTHDPWPLDWQ